MRRTLHMVALGLALVGALGLPGARDARGDPDPSPIHHDDRGELPPAGDQGISMSCVPWALRSIAAFHHRELAPGWRLVELRIRFPFRRDAVVISMRVPVLKPDLDDPRNLPSVTYLNNLSLRRWYSRTTDAAEGQTFEQYVGNMTDPPPGQNSSLTLNVGAVWDTLRSYGAPSEFDAGFTTSVLALPTPAMRERAAELRPRWSESVGQIGEALTPSEEHLRAALASGPALVMLTIRENFGCEQCGKAEYTPDASCSRGTHAMVAVAFEPRYTGPEGASHDGEPAFRLMNCWGKAWGVDGSIWVTSRNLFDSTPEASCREEAGLVRAIRGFTATADAAVPVAATEFPPNWTSPGNSGWSADGARHCTDKRGWMVPPINYVRRCPRWIDLERAARARVTLRTPAIPLVPALLRSEVRWWVDGRPASELDPARTGYRLDFLDRRGDAKAAKPERDGGPGARPLGNGDHKPSPGSEVGADPTIVGAFSDRAVFEIVDPNHPNLVGGRVVRVLGEVYDPGATEPRVVARYRIRVAP